MKRLLNDLKYEWWSDPIRLIFVSAIVVGIPILIIMECFRLERCL